MKIAFLCEGYSEYESLTSLLRSLGIGNYQYIDKWSDTTPNTSGTYYIYRHNYKGIGGMKARYLTFAKLLIDSKNYDKVFAWFDREGFIPVCEYATREYSKINISHRGRIEFSIAVKYLENWYLSNQEIISKLIDEQVDSNYLQARGIRDFLSEGNVDNLNATRILKQLKQNTTISGFSKPEIATRFFSLIGPRLNYRSYSLTRFINKLQEFLQ